MPRLGDIPNHRPTFWQFLPWLIAGALLMVGAAITWIVCEQRAEDLRTTRIARQYIASEALVSRLQSDIDVGFSTLSLFDSALGAGAATHVNSLEPLAAGADFAQLALHVQAMAVAYFDGGTPSLQYWHAPMFSDTPPPSGLQAVAWRALVYRRVMSPLDVGDGVSLVLAFRGSGNRVLMMLVAAQRWVDSRAGYGKGAYALRVDVGDVGRTPRLLAQSDDFERLPEARDAGFVTAGDQRLRFSVAMREQPEPSVMSGAFIVGLVTSALLGLGGGLLGYRLQCADGQNRKLVAAVAVAERRSAIDLASEDGFWELDLRSMHCRLSSHAARLFGQVLGQDSFPAFKLLRRVRRSDRRKLLGALRVVLRERESLDVEIRVVDSDGCDRWLRVRARASGAGGKVPALIGSVGDISLRRGFAMQLAAYRMLLDRLFEMTPSPVIVLDADGRCVMANSAFCALGSLTPERAPGKPIRGMGLPPALVEHIAGRTNDELCQWHDSTRGSNRSCRLNFARSDGLDGRKVTIWMLEECSMCGPDIAILRQAQRDALRRRDQLEAIRRLHEAFIRAPEGRAPFDGMLDALLTLIECEYGFVGEVLKDENGMTLSVPSVGGLFWSDTMRAHYMVRAGQGIELRAIERIFGDCIVEGRPLIANRAEDVPLQLPSCHPTICNFIGLPVFCGSALIGLIGLANREGGFEPGLFDEIAPLLRSVGEVIIARRAELARRKAEHELEHHRDRLSELVQEQIADLREARDYAEAASEAKSAFLANMSHELRTPLHAALSFARLGEARTGSMSEARLREYFVRIRQSGERLLALLDGLLDLAKLEAGGVVLDIVPTDLEGLIVETEREFQALLAARGQCIVRVISKELPHVSCDGLRMGQVLRNLVANAIKFGPEGGTISVKAEVGDNGVEIRVGDQGPGIPASERSTVFEKFVQGSGIRPGAGGTGLGLAICREIVAAHGGVIFVCEASGGGAEIVVRLPVIYREMQMV